MRFSCALAGLALALPAIVQAQRMVGYYGKTVGGGCSDTPSFDPKDLPVELYTHLNFAFALINDDGVIAIDKPEDDGMYKAVNDLKAKKPSLRTAITVGGWDMNMAHYSEMVSSAEKRQKFIQSAIAFVRENGFDGIDFDWEYPSDPKRGGHPEDPENFVTFLKEMREAANAEVLKEGHERLILSIALPGGPFHGEYFLIPKLAEHVDWFNIMAYNLHGQWESMVFCAAPLNDPAIDTEYNGYSLVDAVNSMAPKTVNPRKFNLGLSLSGVTFTLEDSKKSAPGSPAIGPGREGCQEKGAMAYFEARKIVGNVGAQSSKHSKNRRALEGSDRKVTQAPKMDDVSKCMYMVVDDDQWIGYDTPETFAYKVEYLKDYGFGGVSIWSMDSDTSEHELTRSIHDSLNKGFVQDRVGKNSTSKIDAKPVHSNATAPTTAIKAPSANTPADTNKNMANKKPASTTSAASLTRQSIPLLALAALVVALIA
ncbi:hypothetical protein BGX27_006252 [Mortierella sp. AM989]|nr:hypothetical protein BGX27_006252 [Mortierella sp. AM989]